MDKEYLQNQNWKQASVQNDGFSLRNNNSHSDSLQVQGEGNEQSEKMFHLLGEMSFGIISVLTQRVLTHPFVVFRHQCQVNPRVTNYHLTPFSLVSPMFNMQRNQGFRALWKGITNDFYIGLTRKATEIIISENSSLPLTPYAETKASAIATYTKHISLKALSATLALPLMCASHVLQVQSQVVMGESESYFTLFADAYQRVLLNFSSYNETSHLVPLWRLLLPVTALNIGHYIINNMAMAAVNAQYMHSTILLNDSEHDEVPLIKTIYDRYFPRLLGALSGQMISDVFLYPLSTVTSRLIVQGTRTIIDDTDTGNAVVPVTTTYTGLLSCMRETVSEEGVLGLYKGFGALIAQYLVQALVLRGVHLLYERFMDLHYPRVPRRRLLTKSSAAIPDTATNKAGCVAHRQPCHSSNH